MLRALITTIRHKTVALALDLATDAETCLLATTFISNTLTRLTTRLLGCTTEIDIILPERDSRQLQLYRHVYNAIKISGAVGRCVNLTTRQAAYIGFGFHPKRSKSRLRDLCQSFGQ
ncbi:hypothetical protein RSOLAG1IB_02090 [Rhizoctonia solani AG-1 IB]|uniref:Uncharacterized protein n=1 Tax=Thanatephorus cucumeris (strain AG1-IB / isolate 7/3/14) TaxID=1108050 RepID=A0A0B7FH84_THACB|nr:hypothetical protein RSOLAG1IB_02090 [Rhizoctonia solani AG-1 IB]